MELYRAILDHWESDSKRLWNLFSLLSVAQAALLNFAVDLTPERQNVVSIFGIVLCFLWWGMHLRMIRWVEWWEAKFYTIYARYQAGEKYPGYLDLAEGLFKSLNLFFPEMGGLEWKHKFKYLENAVKEKKSSK